MTLSLKKEAFVALAAVAWADDRISRGEGIALVRAAEAAGLVGDDLDAVKRATNAKITLAEFDPTPLSPRERALTHALASWLARVDGVSSQAELEHLRELATRLELPEFKAKSAESAAFDIACLPGGHRPEKYDFAALAERLLAKLPMLTE